MNRYIFTITARGKIRAPGRGAALQVLRQNLHMSLTLHDAVDDFKINLEPDPLSPLYPSLEMDPENDGT